MTAFFRTSFLPILVLGLSASAHGQEVVARLPGWAVTKAELDQLVSRQGLPLNDQNRTRVLRSIAAGYAVEEKLGGSAKTLPPELEKAVGDARRQIMLNYYLDKQLQRPKPDADDIDEFVKKNPQFFGRRATYRFFQILVDTGTKPLPASVKTALDKLQAGGPVDIGRINAFKAVARGAGVSLAAQETFASSEKLGPEQLRQLDGLAGGQGRVLARKRDGNAVELLVLLDRIPDPVDPAEMRAQVAQGLAAQSIQGESARLVDEIGAAKLEELRRAQPDDADVLNLTGKAPLALDPGKEEAGSILDLFGNGRRDQSGSTPGSARRFGQPAGTAGRAALFLALAGIVAPFAAGGASATARRRSHGMVRAMLALVPIAIALALKATELRATLGGTIAAAMLLASLAIGTAATAVWVRRRSRSRGAMLPAVLAMTATVAALWLA